MPHEGWQQVTAATGTPWIRTVAKGSEWFLVVSPLGWGNKQLDWTYGPYPSATEARWAEVRLRRDLAGAPNGGVKAILERWEEEGGL